MAPADTAATNPPVINLLATNLSMNSWGGRVPGLPLTPRLRLLPVLLVPPRLPVLRPSALQE